MNSLQGAQNAFEAWLERMVVSRIKDGVDTSEYNVVYGLVAIGIFLLGNSEWEAYRGELLVQFGGEWFTVDSTAWRETKRAIYGAPSRYDDHDIDEQAGRE